MKFRVTLEYGEHKPLGRVSALTRGWMAKNAPFRRISRVSGIPTKNGVQKALKNRVFRTLKIGVWNLTISDTRFLGQKLGNLPGRYVVFPGQDS